MSFYWAISPVYRPLSVRRYARLIGSTAQRQRQAWLSTPHLHSLSTLESGSPPKAPGLPGDPSRPCRPICSSQTLPTKGPPSMLSSAGHTSLGLGHHSYSPSPSHSHSHPHSHSHSHSHPYQQLKPSPLSSADNAPRSLHLNAVQAVNTHYTTPTAYTHAHSNSSSNSVTTSSNSSFHALHSLPQSQLLSSPIPPLPPPPPPTSSSSSSASLHAPAHAHKGLRRIPGGANLGGYSRHQHLRTNSLSSSVPSGNGTQNSNNNSNHGSMNGGGGASSAAGTSTTGTGTGTGTNTGAVGMPSINAIAAGPAPASAAPPHPHGARFDGPRSPPSEWDPNSPQKYPRYTPPPLPSRAFTGPAQDLPAPSATVFFLDRHCTARTQPSPPKTTTSSTPSTSKMLCDLETPNGLAGLCSRVLELN